MKILLTFLLSILAASVLKGQPNERVRDTTRLQSEFRAGLQYKSDYFFMGRSDSAKAPYATASASYFHRSGLFVGGNISYLISGEEQRIDLYSIALGYDYFGERVFAGLHLRQYFFDDESYSVQSEMGTYLSSYLGYDMKLFTVTADASLGVSSEFDVFVGMEISRAFYFLRNRLRITPSIYTNFGTQKYYRQYYTERSLSTGSEQNVPASVPGGSGTGGSGSGSSGSGSGSGSSGAGSGDGGAGSGSTSGGRALTSQTTTVDNTMITEITTLSSEKFQMLDYELGIQASYRVGKFQFLASVTALFPINPSTVVTDIATYEEDLNTGILWSGGMRYTIR